MMCSYQSINRYHDHDSAPLRIRKSLEDIRLDHRRAVHRARLRLRCSKMLQNRRIIHELPTPDCSDTEDIFYDDDPTLTPPASVLDPSEAPSSSGWDVSSVASSCQASPCTEEELLACFLDTPSPSPVPSSSQSSGRAAFHKSLKESARTSASTKPKCHLDPVKTRLEFDALKDAVAANAKHTDQISSVFHNFHHALVHPLSTYEVHELPQVLEFISMAIMQELVKPATLLLMMQEGLIFHLSDIFARGDPACDNAVFKTISTISHVYPAALPYMIDLLTTTKFFTELDDRIQLVDTDSLLPILEFYYELVNAAIAQLYSNEPVQPLVPLVLLRTGVSKQTLDSYSPLSTLGRIFRPSIIVQIRERCLNCAYYNRSELVTIVLLILASSLKYLHSLSSVDDTSNEQHIGQLLNALEGTDQCLLSVIQSLIRTIETSRFSEHSSQGVGTNTSATTSLDQCRQFLSFFNQYYAPLASSYGAVMRDLPKPAIQKPHQPLDL